jgi:L-lactate dehydrogenase complex protein LldE
MVRNHYAQWLEGHPGFDHLRANTFELCEYLVDIAGVTKVDGDFPLKVGLHMSCHGLRELRLASSSERMVPPFNKVRQLLAQLKGIELIELTRPDECCGFGGTFAVDEEAVSSLMGRDRIADHLHGGAEVITGFDVSCLMHLEGIIRRQALAAGAASVAAYPAAKPAPAAGAPSFGAYPAAKPEKTPLRVMHVAEILEAARLS